MVSATRKSTGYSECIIERHNLGVDERFSRKNDLYDYTHGLIYSQNEEGREEERGAGRGKRDGEGE